MEPRIELPVLYMDKMEVLGLKGRHFSGGKITVDSIAFTNCMLVDCQGYVFEVEKVKCDGRISIFDSFRNFQIMYRYTPILKRDPYKIPLPELKEKVIALVKRHPKRYRSFLPVSMIVEDIGKMTTYEELVRYFP